jgi:hypothetical protein
MHLFRFDTATLARALFPITCEQRQQSIYIIPAVRCALQRREQI